MKPVRNLAVFIDGTDCDFGKSARQQWSNVARLYTAGERLLLEGGRQQVAQYFDGVGSRRSESLVLDEVFGAGLVERVEEAYGWLKKEVANAVADGCEPRLFMFGFSRGAFAVRWLAALVDFCGVPATGGGGKAGLNTFARGDSVAAAELLRKKCYVRVPIAFLGAFDTVKARPGSDYGVRALPSSVDRACHAIALDEWRSDFDVLPFDDDPRVEQKWFAGGHSDIGGGYGDPDASDAATLNERCASDVALEWMVEKAREAGFVISEGYVPPRFSEDVRPVFHDERTWYYKLANGFRAATKLFLRTVPTLADVHESVGFWLDRYNLAHANWSPRGGSSTGDGPVA